MMSVSEIRKKLDQDGYCVIPNVLGKERAAFYLDRIFERFESFNTGFKREDPKTWTSENLPYNIHVLYQHYRLGHEQFVWDLRTEPNIIQVFSRLWGTDKLLVSFDGLNFSKPTNYVSSKSWTHIDQGSKKKGFHCIQGFINLIDCGDKDGGLLLYKGSHKNHREFWTKFGIESKGDWHKFNKGELEFYTKDCQRIKVNCNAGDMVLWDSRCAHHAEPPRENKFRVVVYICMMPVEFASAKDIEKKKKAFKNLRITSHYPCQIKMFPEKPRTYGDESKITKFKVIENPPVLNDIGKRLAGLIPYDD